MASYGVFIGVGLLLSLVPAGRLGLSEEMFFHLRMLLMLLGPVYLSLTAKIVLTFLAAREVRTGAAAEKGQGVLLAVTALLLFTNLSSAQTLSDFAAGSIQGRGLRSLEKSRRYSLKGRRFLNVFLPVGFYLLILEVLTLLVCIVTFPPLSRAASNAFLLLIALTSLALVLVPLILTLLSGYQGDQAELRETRAEEKRRAVQADVLVLESDPALRKKYLRLPKRLVLLVCPGVCFASGCVLALTRDAQDLWAVQLLRAPFLALMTAAAFSLLPLLLYWMNFSGTSLTQRIYLTQNRLYYRGYSGSMEERVEFTFTLLQLERFHARRRAIRIRGRFTKASKDAHGVSQKGPFPKTLWLPRTFPAEQERALLDFLQREARRVQRCSP